MSQETIPSSYGGLPVVSAQEMRLLEGLAQNKHGLGGAQLMENAGKAVAQESARLLADELGIPPARACVAVFCGRGNNGGDGLVAARHLRGLGARVLALLCPPRKDAPPQEGYPELVRLNLEKARACGVEASVFAQEGDAQKILAQADLAIDALLGTGASGKPAGPVRQIIQEITRSKKPVVAVDIPSGIHPDTGYHSGVYVTAILTLTLGLPKRGLLCAHARAQVGRLKVLDIGYPRELLLAAGEKRP